MSTRKLTVDGDGLTGTGVSTLVKGKSTRTWSNLKRRLSQRGSFRSEDRKQDEDAENSDSDDSEGKDKNEELMSVMDFLQEAGASFSAVNPALPEPISVSRSLSNDEPSPFKRVLVGNVNESITCAVVHIANDAVVRGDCVCDKMEVLGQFTGTLQCKELIIYESGLVSGDITYDSLVCEEGGCLTGNVSYFTVDDNS